MVLAFVLVGLVFLAVAASGAAGHSNANPTRLRLVALGDSDTTGSGDPTGVGWVGRYAKLLRNKLGVHVAVKNFAQDGKTSRELLSELRRDAAIRRSVRSANVVLLGIGGADLNAGDARWQAGTCSGKACYTADLRAFGRNFEKAAAVVAELRGGGQTLLRSITLPNAVPGAQDVIPPFATVEIGRWQAATLRREICAAMRGHIGRCIDVLTAFNGPSGTGNAYARGLMNHADCCYASAKGQQLIAKLLLKTGLRRVHLK
jgi:lysophospholipase L1-like esterase